MVDLVAKRYVKALMLDRDDKNLLAICKELKEISTAYTDDKFRVIITSTEVASSRKVELILSFNSKNSDVVVNLIKLLSNNKRLDILPAIVNELEAQLAVLTNSYKGVIYTNKELTKTDVNTMRTKFSKKFNVSLELTQNLCDYDGLKVSIEGLGVEVGFAKSRLKSQMIDHILKAI